VPRRRYRKRAVTPYVGPPMYGFSARRRYGRDLEVAALPGSGVDGLLVDELRLPVLQALPGLVVDALRHLEALRELEQVGRRRLAHVGGLHLGELRELLLREELAVVLLPREPRRRLRQLQRDPVACQPGSPFARSRALVRVDDPDDLRGLHVGVDLRRGVS
jgi:hypothetical protein